MDQSTSDGETTRTGRIGVPFVMDGGRTVVYEETLSLTDAGGATGLIWFVRVAVAILLVGSLASVVLLAVVSREFLVSAFGSIGVVRSILEAMVAERPVTVGGVIVLVLLFGAGAVALLVGFVLQLRGAFDEAIRVSVTDREITVTRENEWYWRPSRVDVPFDAITAVEYLDPEASALRAEIGDLRAPKFLAGRRQDWIRLERADNPPVYIGSDSARELAEIVAERAPAVSRAEPF